MIAFVVAVLSVCMFSSVAAVATSAPSLVEPRRVLTAGAGTVPSGDNAVVRENRLSGTDRWRIPWPGYRLANDVGKEVKGYATQTSVNVGQQVRLRVHASVAGTVSWNVYRLGWYGGAGGREVSGGAMTAGPQPACPTDTSTGQIVCPWSETLTLDVPSAWTSGIYVVVLTSGAGQNYVPFTVRDDARSAALVGLQPVTTYQAYNNYPNDRLTGKSLYGYNSFGVRTVGGTAAAVKVSFDRPYAGHGASTLFADAAPTVRYLESRGFDVKYATSIDLHAQANLLSGARGMLAFGHDEYYSQRMFDAAEQARDANTGLSWFGGNNVYWQVRMEADLRTIVCYRNAALDPEPEPGLKTVLWRTLRGEQRLLGGMWPDNSAGLVGPAAPWTVTNASHWFYRGTRLSNGSQIVGLVGVEADRRVSAYAGPNGSAWTALSKGAFTTRSGGVGLHEATVYQAPGGAWVFNAGTINYPLGLGGEGAASPAVQAMTTNLLVRQSGARLSATTARAYGPNRYDTAVALSRRTFPANFGGTVHLASGLGFPDALGASAASGGNGPILLVQRTSVPTTVLEELRRLHPNKVVIVGGTGVVSDGVASAVRSVTGVVPERLSGANRYGTGAALSKHTFVSGGPVAYVASGLGFPDALAGGAAGAQLGGPVVLTKPTSVPPETLEELKRLRPGRIVLVGGSGVVSDSVAATLSKIAPTVRRAGPDRYATSAAIANDIRGALGRGPVLLASGEDFPDALAAGPAAAAMGGVLTLVPSRATLPSGVAEEIVRNDPDELLAVGGTGVVSDALLKYINALVAPVVAAAPQAGPLDASPEAAPRSSQPTSDELSSSAAEEARQDTNLPWMAR
jgi:putative cell wall-binding protein